MKPSTYSKIAQAVRLHSFHSSSDNFNRHTLTDGFINALAEILAAHDLKFDKKRFLEECNK